MSELKTFLFTYEYDGAKYGLQVKANTQAEAVGRVRKMSTALYDGEIMVTIPIGVSSFAQKFRGFFS